MEILPSPVGRRVYVTWTVLLSVLIAVSFFVPQAGTVLPGSTLAWVIIGLAVGMTGGMVRSRRLRIYGFFAMLTGLVMALAVDSGIMVESLSLIGFGAVIGIGLIAVGFTSEKAMVPLGAYMLIGAVIQYLASPSLQFLVNVTWLMLGGAAFASFGYLLKNPFAHFVGMAFIFGVLATYLLIGPDYFMVGMVGLLIILGGLVLSFVYMYHSLGRPPNVGEVLTLAARALFTYGLRRPLEEYRVIAISIQGDISTELVVNELVSKLDEKWRPILVLGPTSPTEIKVPPAARVGWVTSISGIAGQAYSILPPGNPSEVNIFISDAVKATPPGQTPIIIGDFMDNMIPLMKEDAFFRYYSDLASRVKVMNETAVFIVKSDIHSEVTVNVVKRFADVIIENREREERHRFVREVRVSNKIDNFSTEWEKVPVPVRIRGT